MGALTQVLGQDGGFTTALISHTESQLPDLTADLVNAKDVKFYVEHNSIVRGALLAATPDVTLHFAADESTNTSKLFPGGTYNRCRLHR